MAVAVLNCGYGNGPVLRAAEVACAINRLRRAAQREPLRIVVPVSRETIRHRILREELREGLDDLVWDETFDTLISPLHYAGNRYEEFLSQWLKNHRDVHRQVRDHLGQTYGADVALEISRAPLLPALTDQSVYISFARQSTILRQSMGVPDIAIDDAVLRPASEAFAALEGSFRYRYITQPGTFGENAAEGEAIPLTSSPPVSPPTGGPRSVYVSVSGINGLESMYADIADCGWPVFSNQPDAVPGAAYAPPGVLAHDQTVLQVARAGWGAVWNSLLTDTPLLCLPYHRADDPEIFWNQKRIEQLGIGAAYSPQTMARMLEDATPYIQRLQSYKQSLIERFGTLDGARYVAQRILDHADALSSPSPSHRGQTHR